MPPVAATEICRHPATNKNNKITFAIHLARKPVYVLLDFGSLKKEVATAATHWAREPVFVL
jgi:hypothetical protein